jgi:hypothetical protein
LIRAKAYDQISADFRNPLPFQENYDHLLISPLHFAKHNRIELSSNHKKQIKEDISKVFSNQQFKNIVSIIDSMQSKSHGCVLEFQVRRSKTLEETLNWYDHLHCFFFNSIMYWLNNPNDPTNLFSVHASSEKTIWIQTQIHFYNNFIQKAFQIAAQNDKQNIRKECILFPSHQIMAAFLQDIINYIFTGTLKNYSFLFGSSSIIQNIKKYNRIIFNTEYYSFPNESSHNQEFKNVNSILPFINGNTWYFHLRNIGKSKAFINEKCLQMSPINSFQRNNRNGIFQLIGEKYKDYIISSKLYNFKKIPRMEEIDIALSNPFHSIIMDSFPNEQIDTTRKLIQQRKRSINNNSSYFDERESEISTSNISNITESSSSIQNSNYIVDEEGYTVIPSGISNKSTKANKRSRNSNDINYIITDDNIVDFTLPMKIKSDFQRDMNTLEKVADAMYQGADCQKREFLNCSQNILEKYHTLPVTTAVHYRNIKKDDLVESTLFKYVGHDIGCFQAHSRATALTPGF